MLYKYTAQAGEQVCKAGKKIFFFSKYTMFMTLTLLTHVLGRQIGWVLLVERNQEI